MQIQFARCGIYAAFIVGLLFLSVSHARADACWDHWKAKLNAEAARGWGLTAKLKKSGDCSLVSAVMASNYKYDAILRAVPCDNMTKNYGNNEVARAKLMRYCKPQAPRPQTQEAAKAPQSAPPDGSSSNSATRKSASCSDITGTGSATSGAGDCREADRALYAARSTRQSAPALAADQYKKAAAAARRANDTELELTILREAAEATALPRVANAPNSPADGASQTPNIAPEGGQDSAGDKTIPTPCQDLTGKFGCRDGSNLRPLEQTAKLNEGETQRLNRPRPWRPDQITPDYTAAIMRLADAILDANGQKGADATRREQMRHALLRRLADHRATLKPAERSCLQPVVVEGPRFLDYPLRWHPYHIEKEAIDQSHLCDGVSEGEAKDTCRDSKYGEAVMWAEPEMAGQCRGAGDLDAVAECARRKFLNAWAKNDGVVQAPAPDRWIMPGTCNPSGTTAQRKDTLRDLLRARLAAARDSSDAVQQKQDAELAPKAEAAQSAGDDPSPPPLIDANEAFCSYMARAVIRGELTLGGSTPIPPECKASIAAAEALKAKQQKEEPQPFTMSDVETDREVARMVGTAATEPVAK